MKILILHKGMVIGGVEKVLLSYVNIFREMGIDIDILLTYNLSFKKEHLQDNLSSFPVYYTLSSQMSSNILNAKEEKKKSFRSKAYYELSRFYLNLRQSIVINSLVKNNSYDIVIDFSGVLEKARLNIIKDIPLIRWVHSENDVRDILRKPKKYHKYTKLVLITQGMRNALLCSNKFSEDKLHLVYNPINLEEIEKKSEQKLENIEKHYFLTVSRLVEGKGLFELIDIYDELKREGIREKLYILGDGELRPHLEEKIKQLSLENECILLGARENPFPYFKHSKLFLFTSESEGFGMVILESMACGTPTVVMDCPIGPKEILGENSTYGKLIPLHNSSDFIQAVRELLDNKELYQYYRMKGLERSLQFSSEKIKRELQLLFYTVIQNHNGLPKP